MAEVLDYISHQIENLKESVEENNLLKSSGIYELTMYIARNTNLLNGGGSVESKYDRISAKYGISVEFLREAKREANKQKKDKLKTFIDIVASDKPDRDVKEVLTKLFRYGDGKRDDLIIAFVNTLNYSVLNKFYEIADDSGTFRRENCNITYRSLPYGQIVPIPFSGRLMYQDNIGITELSNLIVQLNPVNKNQSNEDVLKYYQSIYNEEERYIEFDYKKTGAKGYIKNDTLNFSNDLTEISCKPLTGGYIEYEKSSSQVCSSEELKEIEITSQIVKEISNNTDFEKIEGITGSKLYQSVNNFARLSANFKDNTNARNSINIKLYFDKREDVFATIRSNDLKLAVACADYGNDLDGLIDLYFNPETEDLYFVNQNKEQYGYCRGLLRTEMSNCEHSIYTQLLQPALSQEEKTKLFLEGNILPVVLEDRVIKETEGLQDAQIRQGYLLAVEDDKIFYDLFVRNIASYVYSYARQIEKKDAEGKIKLIWETIPNPKWSVKEDDEWIPIYNENNKLKWYQWANPDIFYIYDVRETFWSVNQNMSIKEVLAFFVSKGGSSKNNSKYYRKLSQRILGVDYFVFSQKLIPFLLKEGLLCIEELDFDKTTNALLKYKYQYKYQYAKDDVYKKIDKLINELEPNIKLLYGDVLGAQIVDYQFSLLQKSKPDLVKFGHQNKAKKLTLSIHNPILFNDFREDGYVNRFADVANIFKRGRISISTKQKTDEKYKPLEIDSALLTLFTRYEESRHPSLKNNHLGKFIEWLKFSKVSKTSKEYLTEPRIVDGYVLPLPAKDFIPIYLMPNFEFQSSNKEKLKLPLKFRKGKPNQMTFSISNIWNTRTQSSRLTKESIDNLVKSGLVSRKKLIDGYKESVINKKTGLPKEVTLKINPLNVQEAKMVYDTIMAKYNKLESEIRIEGDRLFTLFCQTQMTGPYRNQIEEVWNSTYNNMASPEDKNGRPDYSKFPIFCEHSRWFGKYKNSTPFQFNLREAQVEGLKFSIANSNSGLLAHEVGFGKTTTSIAMISNMNLTGSSSRNLVFTPKQVYEKFDDEITGNEQTGVLGLLGNYKNPYNVIKLGNARKDILMGKLKPLYKGSDLYAQEGNESLKIYTTEEIQFIQDFKNVVNEAREQMSDIRKVPAKQPRFFTEPELLNETDSENRIPTRIQNSSARLWWAEFYGELITRYGEIIELPAVEELLDLVDKEIDKNERIIEKQIDYFRKKQRYTRKNFVDDKGKQSAEYKKLPKYIQEWWNKRIQKLSKYRGKPDYAAIRDYEYPHKFWVTEPKGALEFKFITKKEYDDIVDDKTKTEYFGTLTPTGLKKIIELDDKVSQDFFNYKDGRKLGKMTTLLNAIREQLIDELGLYKEFVSRPNSIILCYHQAIDRFRVSELSRNQAKKYVGNVDDVMYVSHNIDRKYDQLGIKPLSLAGLNITGVVVDEIHNFNNLIGRPRPTNLTLLPDRFRGEQKNFALLPTERSSAIMKKLPDGGSIGHSGIDRKNPYSVQFNSTGKGTLKNGPTNLLAIIFEVQNIAKFEYGVADKNTIMMSATPFTDNVFQMFTVFGMTNVERMKEANLDKVFDFFITFVKEEWRYNLTHRNVFGLFAEIEGYYNTYAMSNFIKSFANFKVSDAVIEAQRPQKYLIPQGPPTSNGSKLQAGSNTSSQNWSKDLQDVSSYVELSSVQKSIIKTIGDFVEGKIATPYAMCPNYLDVKVEKSGEVKFEDEDIQTAIDEIRKVLREATSFEKRGMSSEAEEKLEDAYDLSLDLFSNNSKNEIIKSLYLKISDMIDPSEEGDTDITSYEIDIDDLGLVALDEQQLFKAKAIVGQSFGQICVISPYLLKCDREGELENSLLKDYPLLKYKIRRIGKNEKGKKEISIEIDEKKRDITSKNFVEQSPKIKYAIDCAINSIKYDSKNEENNKEVGGQIIYLDRGKNFKYGGNNYNAYELIKNYIIAQKIEYAPGKTIGEEEIGVITGSMGSKGLREVLRDKFNEGEIKILLGSSAIKEGIDLQKRAHTLYILDSDFSPSNAMQLEGRIWRQGNMWENVRIVYVLGRDSIDAFVYSKLQQKINEIKKMLEAGVYELNRTQFTIDAKERIRRIISDIGQLTELEWQDFNDSQLSKLSEYTSEQSALKEVKQEYGKVKSEYAKYIVLVNEMYKVVVQGEKILLAKEIKEQEDILRENQYRVKGAKEGFKWRKENPFTPISMTEALKILDEEIQNNEIVFELKDITLNSDTSVIDANIIISKVIRLVMQNKSILQKMSVDDYLKKNTLKSIKSKTDDEKVITDRLIQSLFNIKDWATYDEILKEVSKFDQGAPKERIMSNYTGLVESRTKRDSKGKEMTKNGKPIKCEFIDIPTIISQLESKVTKINTNLSTLGKKKFFSVKSKEIERSLESQKKIVGNTLEELVEKFENSMKLLKTRKK